MPIDTKEVRFPAAKAYSIVTAAKLQIRQFFIGICAIFEIEPRQVTNVNPVNLAERRDVP